MNIDSSKKTGWVERYFLRRLAIELGKRHKSELTPYRNALVSVIGITIILPSVAVLSFVGIATMQLWSPIVSQSWPWLSFRQVGLAIIIFDFLVGYHFWGGRFKKYKYDYLACNAYNTDRDHKIVLWQFYLSVFICNLLIPLLGVVVSKVL